MNAQINPLQVKKLRSSIRAGIIDVPELDRFLECLELQLQSNERKTDRVIYHHGKPVKANRY